jgi:diphthamide synthase subunit DPH2
MGNWAITIQGIGSHHNKALPDDANRMARRFVKELKKAGHTIVSADFTHGANEDLCDPDTEHADDRDASGDD